MKYYKRTDGCFSDTPYCIKKSQYTNQNYLHFWCSYGWSLLIPEGSVDGSYEEISKEEAESMIFAYNL